MIYTFTLCSPIALASISGLTCNDFCIFPLVSILEDGQNWLSDSSRPAIARTPGTDNDNDNDLYFTTSIMRHRKGKEGKLHCYFVYPSIGFRCEGHFQSAGIRRPLPPVLVNSRGYFKQKCRAVCRVRKSEGVPSGSPKTGSPQVRL